MSFDKETIGKQIAYFRSKNMTASEIAKALNNLKYRTASGLEWNSTRVNQFAHVNPNFLKTIAHHQQAVSTSQSAPMQSAPVQSAPTSALPPFALEILKRNEWSAEKRVRVLLAMGEP